MWLSIPRLKFFGISLLVYREQLESLAKLEWPLLSRKSVPWALHTPSCYMDGWSPVRALSNEASSLAVADKEEHNQEAMDVDVVEKSGTMKEDLEGVREDGELPSLLPNMSVVGDGKPPNSKGSNLDHSKQLSLISKSVTPSLKVKSRSFKNYDENTDILLDVESDLDEPAQIQPETEDKIYDNCSTKCEISWMDYGVKEFCLVLSRKIGVNKKNMNLEAKVYSLPFSP